jgi:hypothetical protein
LVFLEALLARCGPYRDTSCLTLTAMHPDGDHPAPSRHIPWRDPAALHDALTRLDTANRQGWGAFFAVGLRKAGLGRWRRGGAADVVALPALFADVDDPSPDTLRRLQNMTPTPSCITFTNGGFHALWWLGIPTTDLERARQVLRALAVALGGDVMSPAQSLRLVGTRNTKPSRGNALCRLVVLQDYHYTLSDFDHLVKCLAPRRKSHPPVATPAKHPLSRADLNPALIAAVTESLIQQGYRRSGDWLSGPCPYAHRHEHDDLHVSFGFNSRTGYGNCFRCGSILLKNLCLVLGLHPVDYGGLVEYHPDFSQSSERMFSHVR